MTLHRQLALGNKILVIFYFIGGLLIGFFSLIGIVIQVCIWFGETESATVIKWSRSGADEYVELEFFNRNDSLYYTVTKEIHQRSVYNFKKKKEINIRYSRLFPSSIRVVGMREYDVIIHIIGVVFGGALCFRAILVLRNKLKLDDFVG